MNSAFLSWNTLERLEQNPDNIDLRTIPSAVAGNVTSRCGVAAATSISAKRLGVKSGEPVSATLRLCPGPVLVASNFSYYHRKPVAFLEILNHHSPAMEQFSIDKAFLNMSARFLDYRREEATIRACAVIIQTEAREAPGFTIGVGISGNKFLAETVSDFEKPDRIHTLWPEELSARFYSLSTRALFGTGGQNAEKLLRFGIHTIGEIIATPCEILQCIPGPSAGKVVYQSMCGINHFAVRREHPQVKSHSVECTTAVDIEKRNAATELPPLFSEPVERLSSRLKRVNVRAEALVIIAKTSSFRHHACQQRLLVPNNEKEVLETNTHELLSVFSKGEDGLFSKRETLRLVGIGTTHLEDLQYQQLSLFSLPSAAEVRETEARAVAEATEAEKRAAVVAVQTGKRRKSGEMQTAISARYGDKTLLYGGALLSAERNEIPNMQIKSKQQGAEIKEP